MLYLLANVEYVREVCSQLYMASIECLNKKGKTFLPRLAHHFCRAVHHTHFDSLSPEILEDLLAATAKHMSCSYAFSFTKFGVSLA